jgi:hypothetical protein
VVAVHAESEKELAPKLCGGSFSRISKRICPKNYGLFSFFMLVELNYKKRREKKGKKERKREKRGKRRGKRREKRREKIRIVIAHFS